MKFKSRSFRVTLLVASIIFTMGMTTVPASAIDLGAKGKYIISVKPAATRLTLAQSSDHSKLVCAPLITPLLEILR